MQLRKFASISLLFRKTELEKVRLLAFFHIRKKNVEEFSVDDVATWFAKLNLPIPNKSRLRSNIKKSRTFIKGSTGSLFRLHANEITSLESEYPDLLEESEETISEDTILPGSLYLNTRGYIELLSKQINASFENNIYDGCAVLMRRLVEILLIHSYQYVGIEGSIKDASGNYKPLENIIGDAKPNQKLDLSRDTKTFLDVFRTLGNFSAHKIYYNCKRTDLTKVLLQYRATIEELLYKSGIRA